MYNCYNAIVLILYILKCTIETPLKLFSTVPPLPAEWKYVMLLLISFLKPVRNPSPPQTTDAHFLHINQHKCKFKSSSRMATRNSRTRSSPSTRKTRKRRKQVILQHKTTNTAKTSRTSSVKLTHSECCYQHSHIYMAVSTHLVL